MASEAGRSQEDHMGQIPCGRRARSESVAAEFCERQVTTLFGE
jgi:hypothetical protein